VKILAIEKEIPGVADESFRPFLKAEATRAWELYQSGTIREMYFRADREEAILILECKSMKEAKNQLGTLLLVKAGLIAFDIVPLKAYPGFARLFSLQ
jgi:hypothetical protein